MKGPSKRVQREMREINEEYQLARERLEQLGVCFDYVGTVQQLSLREHVRAQYELMKDAEKRHPDLTRKPDNFILPAGYEAVNSWLVSETGISLQGIVGTIGEYSDGSHTKMRELMRQAQEDEEIEWGDE